MRARSDRSFSSKSCGVRNEKTPSRVDKAGSFGAYRIMGTLSDSRLRVNRRQARASRMTTEVARQARTSGHEFVRNAATARVPEATSHLDRHFDKVRAFVVVSPAPSDA